MLRGRPPGFPSGIIKCTNAHCAPSNPLRMSSFLSPKFGAQPTHAPGNCQDFSNSLAASPGYRPPGCPGATLNVSSKGHQETVGLAGSGLSYRTKRRRFRNHGGPVNAPRQPVTAAHVIYVIVIVLVILWILAHVLH